MKIINAGKASVPLCLGRGGENLVTCIVFDVSNWIDDDEDGEIILLHKRFTDASPYPAGITVTDGTVSWPVTSLDTARAGKGECELQYVIDGTVRKSGIWPTITLASLDDSNADGLPANSWIADMLAAMQEIVGTVPVVSVVEDDEGVKTLTVTVTDLDGNISTVVITDGAAATIEVGTVTTGEPGTDAEVINSGTATAAIFNFTIPRGDKGDTGNLLWPELDVDAERAMLVMTVPEDYDSTEFSITDEGMLTITYE